MDYYRNNIRPILPLFHVMFEVINPFKDFGYFYRYYQSLIEHDHLSKCTHRAIIGYFWCGIIRQWLLFYLPLSDQFRIMLFDYNFMIKLKPLMSPMLTLILWQAKSIEGNQYWNVHPKILIMLRQILGQSDQSYFEWSDDDHADYLERRQPAHYCRTVQRFAWLSFRAMQAFIVALHLMVLSWHFQMIILIYEYREFFLQNYWWSPFKILIMESNLLCLAIGFYSLANYSIIFGLQLSVLTLIVMLKFRQQTEFLQTRFQKLRGGDLYLFMEKHTDTVHLVSKLNQSQSKCFLVVLLTSIPYNVFLILSIMFEYSKQTNLVRMILFTMAMQQFVSIFGLHLLFTRYPKAIHNQAIPQLLSLDARFRFESSRTHLKVTNYVLKFHTKNRYGMTYNKLGLITLESFIKFSMIYCKLLIMVYKMFRSSEF